MDRVGSIAKAVAQTGALQLGFFTDSSGQPAPLYLDLGKLWQDPTMLSMVAREMCSVIREEMGEKYVRLGGSDHSGLPLAALASQILHKPLVVLRRGPLSDTHGPVLGTMFPGDEVLLLDDVIATGKKALDMAKIVKQEGGVLYGYCVLLDMQGGGSELLRRKGIRFACAATLVEVATELDQLGWLEENILESILEYVGSFTR